MRCPSPVVNSAVCRGEKTLRNLLPAGGIHTHGRVQIAVVGLDNSGKTTLLSSLSRGDGSEAPGTVPTIGLDLATFRKGNVEVKAWDLAGQSAYRREWPRYIHGVDVLVFVVDVADPARLPEARNALHSLLEDTALADMPMLIAANKVDITPHVNEDELIKALNLDYVIDQPWIVVPVSARYSTNLEAILDWLLKQRRGEPTRASGGLMAPRR